MKSFPDVAKVFLILCVATIINYVAPTKAIANVRCIQSFLSDTVFDPGPVDGAWGKKTAAALQDYASYHELIFTTKIDRKNAMTLCSELKAFQLPLDAPLVRRFDVNIVLKDLEEFTGRKHLDLSNINVMTMLNQNECLFSISRQQIESKKIEELATGQFSVESGLIKFGKNSWKTGGLADSSYLQEQGVLAFSDDYLLNGSIPYFHMFVSPGEIAQRPMQIDFFNTEEDNSYKNEFIWRREYRFDVDNWQTGIIGLRCRAN